MKNWFSNIGYKIQQFMQGRYGFDELSRFLAIAGLILMLLSSVPYLRIMYFLAFALLIWPWFRGFSRNTYRRQMERSKYLTVKNKVKQPFLLYRNIWRDRRTHKYCKCPHCKATVRISKPEKGRTIAIDCPKCGQSFIKRT